MNPQVALKQPQKSLQFSINGTTFEIQFPNNEQYLRIQNKKLLLSPNYDALSYIGAEGEWAHNLVDVEAHLSVLCPDFIKSLSKKFGELSLIEGRELVEAYSEQFRPWYNEWMNFIFSASKKADETTA
mgnify:CR=1 FL=1